jgi:hypothetical protein
MAIRQAGFSIAIAFREKHGAFGFRISALSTVTVFDCEIASLGRAYSGAAFARQSVILGRDFSTENKLPDLLRIDHSGSAVLKHYFDMKKELSLTETLAVPCPTCGAASGEKCELSTGQLRTNSHRDRRLIAKEQS